MGSDTGRVYGLAQTTNVSSFKTSRKNGQENKNGTAAISDLTDLQHNVNRETDSDSACVSPQA